MSENKIYALFSNIKYIYHQEDIVYSPFLYDIRRILIGEMKPNEVVYFEKNFSQYIFVNVRRGAIEIKEKNCKTIVRANNGYFYQQNGDTEWRCISEENAECYYVAIKGNNVSLIYSEYRKKENGVMEVNSRLAETLENILLETKKTQVNKQQISVYIYSLLLQLVKTEGSKKERITAKSIEYIEKNYQNDELSIEDLARNLNISYYYFCHLFKQENLISPQKYLLKYRLNKALELLKESDLSIEDVSINAGFKNKKALVKACKEETGLLPFKYRKVNKTTPLKAKQTKKILFTNVSNIGDPFIIVENKKYYMFTTTRNGANFNCYVSEDMKYYDFVGEVLNKNKTFGKTDFWAPEVIKYNGEFCLFYSARTESGIFHINVAKSKTLEEPFEDWCTDGPLLNLDKSTIDAHPFIDDDGRIYLFFSMDCSTNIIDGKHVSEIYAVELNKELHGIIGEIIKVSSPTEEWEKLSSNDYYWNEGPSIVHLNGIYYLTYSANYFGDRNYCVGVATSKSVLGPYEKKKDGPILKKIDNVISGPGHCSFFYDNKNNFKCVYHIHSNQVQNSADRRACISSAFIDSNNELVIDYK